MKRIDITGQRFGRLTVLMLADRSLWKRPGDAYWHCRCDCGQPILVRGYALNTGHTQSCGCFCKDQHPVAHGLATRTSRHPLYKAWDAMKQRCNNPNCRFYKNYGRRGIRVCEAWNNSFEAFYSDVKDLYVPGWSMDRINNDGNYEPGNVRWADRKTQNTNKRQRGKAA